MSTDLEFANKMLLLRRAMGLNQDEFANILGVSRNYVSMIESARRSPSSALKARVEQLRVARRELPIESEAREVPIESEVLSPALREGPFLYRKNACQKLRERRLERYPDVVEFAKLAGYKTVSIYQAIEEGTSKMGEKMARKVAKLLDLDPEELLAGSEEPPSRDGYWGTMGAVPQIGLEPDMKAKYIPLLSMAQCGEMTAWDDTGYTQQGFLVINCTDPKAFAVTLSGDSMRDRYQPGDVATVYPSKEPRNGGLVIAKLAERDGDGVMFKEYHAKGDQITLTSFNKEYPDRTFRRNQFAWIYPVGKVTHNLL